MDRARARSTHLGHHCYFPLAKTLRTMDLRRLRALETIDPTPLAPWRAQAFAEIEIEPNREQAKENAAMPRPDGICPELQCFLMHPARRTT